MAHNDVAVLRINELYQLFVEIGFVETHDISWPPHEDGSLDESLCRKYGCSESAIDVLRRIPWFKGDGFLPIDEETYAVDWSVEERISASRRPEDGLTPSDDMIEDPVGEAVPAGFVTISTYLESPGRVIAIDTATGMSTTLRATYSSSDSCCRVDAFVECGL
jgi:hypothetical protein